MIQKEDKEIVNWLDNKIEKVKSVIDRFKEGNHLVSFNDISELTFEFQEIAPNVLVKIIHKSKRKITLQCKMEKDAMLLIHAHPDYLETFRIKSGILFDKESNSTLDSKNGKTFELNQFHTMVAIKKSDMEIDCTYHG